MFYMLLKSAATAEIKLLPLDFFCITYCCRNFFLDCYITFKFCIRKSYSMSKKDCSHRMNKISLKIRLCLAIIAHKISWINFRRTELYWFTFNAYLFLTIQGMLWI